MDKNYKLVLYPFLDDEDILFFENFKSDEIELETYGKPYILLSYNKYLQKYIILDCNFNLNGLEDKLQQYFE